MPDSSDNYQLPSWPPTAINRDLWNAVMGSISARLSAREDLEADFETLIAQGTQASLDYIQATVAPQVASLQLSIELAQEQIDQIVIDGISPNSAKLGGQLPGYYATAQALSEGLSGKVPTTRTVNSKPLNADIALDKSDVGLGNVDNTKDSDKPISTPQAEALAKRLRVDGAQVFTAAEKAQAIANLVGGQISGIRNLLINPRFEVNQPVTAYSQTLAANAHWVDGWKAGPAGCTLSTAGNVVTITAGALVQIIDGRDIETGTHVINWTGSAPCTVGGGAVLKGGTFALTRGTNMAVSFGVGTLSFPQLEPGETPTPFERRPVALEEALCQTRYEIVMGVAGSYQSVAGVTFSSPINFRKKRATPVFLQLPGGVSTNVASAGVDQISVGGARYLVTGGPTAGINVFAAIQFAVDARL